MRAARDKCEAARQTLGDGSDPAVARQADKRAERESAENDFETVAREWLENIKPEWSAQHHVDERIARTVTSNCFTKKGKTFSFKTNQREISFNVYFGLREMPGEERAMPATVREIFEHENDLPPNAYAGPLKQGKSFPHSPAHAVGHPESSQ